MYMDQIDIYVSDTVSASYSLPPKLFTLALGCGARCRPVCKHTSSFGHGRGPWRELGELEVAKSGMELVFLIRFRSSVLSCVPTKTGEIAVV